MNRTQSKPRWTGLSNKILGHAAYVRQWKALRKSVTQSQRIWTSTDWQTALRQESGRREFPNLSYFEKWLRAMNRPIYWPRNMWDDKGD